MQQETSLIVFEQNIPLADSREIARQLDIEHRSFFRMIAEYEQEIEEDFGQVRFEIAAVKTPGSRGAKHVKYALLTENQTYAYMSYSQNTPQARACKRLLVKAFAEAKGRLKEALSLAPAINNLWERRAVLFNQHTQIPDGYWCIFREIASECCWLERRGIHLQEDAVPDISVGLLWMKEVRRLNLDERCIQQYPHHYPDRRSMQYANIYPNAWLELFRDWFQGQYLRCEFSLYIQKHTLQLAPSSARRQLSQG